MYPNNEFLKTSFDQVWCGFAFVPVASIIGGNLEHLMAMKTPFPKGAILVRYLLKETTLLWIKVIV